MSWKEFYAKKFTIQDFLNNLHWHSFFLELIYKEKNRKILEVGSGSGSMCVFLSYLGLDVVAMDNDGQVLQHAKEFNNNLHGNAVFVLAEIIFDMVYHQGFLEHFSNDEIVLLIKKQLRVAKKVAFSVPSKYYPPQDFGNEALMSHDNWRRILCDFAIGESAYYYWEPRIRPILDCLRHLKLRRCLTQIETLLLRKKMMYCAIVEHNLFEKPAGTTKP
jgi:SAM-dependent methyltransferase